jgi:small GTP-binding protein
MDIVAYAHAKFEIADLLRLAAVKSKESDPTNLYPFEDLFARLAEDRFNIAVVGQFSRGKTSLMNAMLGTDRLPTGIVPLTSVITTVQYGPKERAVLEYEDRRYPYEVPLDTIAEYVSQRQNPGNEKRIKYARVELPAELLRQGFFLVDTPGLGSAIAENTRTTENFLPEADAFILVTSYDSPLSSDEHRLLHVLRAHRYRTFLIVNKSDLVSEADRLEADRHIQQQLQDVFGEAGPERFSVSARDAMDARKKADSASFQASGLPAFIERLLQFLVEEKQAEFLRRLIERVDDRLKALGRVPEEVQRLSTLRDKLFAGDEAASSAHANFMDPVRSIPGRFTACLVCKRIEKAAWGFLTKYQYQITIDRQARDALGDAGGLCAFHTWQYAAIASTHGTCVAFPAVLDHFAKRLACIADGKGVENIAGWRPANESCIFCRTCAGAEAAALSEAQAEIDAAQKNSDYPSLCLPHLAVLHDSGAPVPPRFMAMQVEIFQRLAEDMRRYALKRDGSRRAFNTSDEIDSDVRGLRLVAGHRSLSFPPPLDR